MDYLKQHKIKIIAYSLLTIFVFIFAYIIISIAFPKSSAGLYGNRLANINDYKIDKAKLNEMKDKIIGTEKVNKVSYKLQGKIINVLMTVKEDVAKDVAITLSNNVLETFTSDELSYYDVQIFINNPIELNPYQIIGYKHHTTANIVWSNNSI